MEFGEFGTMRFFVCNFIKRIVPFGFLLVFIGCGGSLPASIGDFAPCPESPHCVSTKSSREEQGIQPFKYLISKETAKQGLLEIVRKMPGAEVKINREYFVHSEFTSSVMGFVDDVEFYFEEGGVINFRSSSRIGYYDFDTNRKRMEEIRKQFSAVSGVK
jgi:uncharacterized protein (DUF1499 family)